MKSKTVMSILILVTLVTTYFSFLLLTRSSVLQAKGTETAQGLADRIPDNLTNLTIHIPEFGEWPPTLNETMPFQWNGSDP
jgi:hypothetical protein